MTDSLLARLSSVASLAPPPEVSARVRAEVAAGLLPKRGALAISRWFLGIGAVALTFIAAAATNHGPSGDFSRSLPLLITGMLMVAGATLVALARPRGAPASVQTRIIVALLAPAGFAAVVGLSQTAIPLVDRGVAEGSTSACLVRGAVLALLPLAAFGLLWRRTDPFTPRLTGALIGAWAGLTAAVGLTVSCPTDSAAHVAVGHGGALLAGALLGVWIGRRVLSP